MMFCVVVLPGVAFAGHGGGSGGGGGALGHVSSGLGHASSSASSSSSGGSRGGGSSTTVIVDSGPCCESSSSSGSSEELPPLPGEEPPSLPARVVGYVGVQKVHDSDHSLSLELALVDRWARVGFQLTQFSEDQGEGMKPLTLSMPSFTVGVRIDQGYAGMRAYLEGGVVGAKTSNDPTMDTSWVGGLGGLRVELPLAPHTQLVATAQEMLFTDHVRASAGTVGLQAGPLQLSMRVVDFNVGPALWGPEVGLKF